MQPTARARRLEPKCSSSSSSRAVADMSRGQALWEGGCRTVARSLRARHSHCQRHMSASFVGCQ
eukprot:1474285-Amphidinium_carterae.1